MKDQGKYKVIKSDGRGARYMRDGKFTSVKEVPEGLLAVMEPGKEYTMADIYTGPPVKECLFCGATAKLTRAVNMQTVYLCDEHYYSENVGKIAGRLKELNYG